MSKWREYRISELGTVNRGKSKHRPRNDKILYGGEYPFIQTGDVKEANFHINKHTETYNDLGLAQSKLWNAGTLCITIAANIGDTGILTYPACFPDSIVGFQPYEGVSDVRFVKYYFDIYKKHMESISMGATQNNLSIKKLESIKFLFPDLETQEKIADILSNYDRLIENNNRRIEILEKTAEEIYKEWFVRMRFPGHENTKFIQGIPEEWEVRKFINKEVKLISSGINKFEGLKRYMATADVEGISLKHGEDITFTERPSRANMQPKENTIWFAKMQDTIKHLYFRNHSQKLIENIILSTGFAGIEFKNINHYYYYLSFIRYGIFEDIKDMYANGSTQVAINNQNIKRIRLLMPDKELLNAFNNIVELNFEMIEKYKEQNQNLIKQRDLLLPRLMNGTIEVK